MQGGVEGMQRAEQCNDPLGQGDHCRQGEGLELQQVGVSSCQLNRQRSVEFQLSCSLAHDFRRSIFRSPHRRCNLHNFFLIRNLFFQVFHAPPGYLTCFLSNILNTTHRRFCKLHRDGHGPSDVRNLRIGHQLPDPRSHELLHQQFFLQFLSPCACERKPLLYLEDVQFRRSPWANRLGEPEGQASSDKVLAVIVAALMFQVILPVLKFSYF
mmetsp:Transcript_87064/g.232112  ORF Transcript_87064/g.232112 Transcript_87064/m.232112 type:complete len:212 (-) Transcript_87064:2336-2971(-)